MYKSVNNKIRGPKIIIKKSRFIATIIPVSTYEEIVSELQILSKEMKKASHNAFAYRILENNVLREDLHDDGEVPTTAGIPILNVLRNSNLINILLVVSRYYGGINLGKGGLIRAYSQTAKDLVAHINLIDFVR
ncbi:MAG: YigZ family protein [Candidatus Heimdallarchaeota archaeon]|nr:YigZ family protein [Candidatus Heimdallarchaeota archaeon]